MLSLTFKYVQPHVDMCHDPTTKNSANQNGATLNTIDDHPRNSKNDLEPPLQRHDHKKHRPNANHEPSGT